MSIFMIIIRIILCILLWGWMWGGVHHWTKGEIKYKGCKQIIYGPLVWIAVVIIFFQKK